MKRRWSGLSLVLPLPLVALLAAAAGAQATEAGGGDITPQSVAAVSKALDWLAKHPPVSPTAAPRTAGPASPAPSAASPGSATPRPR